MAQRFLSRQHPARQMLPYYAQVFSLTELNYTWYAMPRAYAIERMLDQVGSDFKFAAKLTRTMTHEIDPKQWLNQVNQYREDISPPEKYLVLCGDFFGGIFVANAKHLSKTQCISP